MKKEKHQDGDEVTPLWVYCNPNPRKRRTGDCVVRAISLATGKPWAELLREMTEWLIPRGDVFDEKSGFGPYLEQVHGFTKMKMPRTATGGLFSLGRLLNAELLPYGYHAVVQLQKHLTYVRNGQFYDIWDCTSRTVYNYWLKRL